MKLASTTVSAYVIRPRSIVSKMPRAAKKKPMRYSTSTAPCTPSFRFKMWCRCWSSAAEIFWPANFLRTIAREVSSIGIA